MPKDPTAQLADLLERSGYRPDEARTLALDVRTYQARVEVCTTFSGVHADFLPRLWEQASRNGDKRCLVLEITAEGDEYSESFGHLYVEVKGTQSWAGLCCLNWVGVG